MAVEDLAARHAAQRVSLAKRAARRLAELWRSVDPQNIAASWQALLPAVLVEMSAAQAAAAGAADGYLAAVAGAGEVRVVPAAFAGIASDGRPLASLLYRPAVTSLRQIAAGNLLDRSLATGAFELDLIARTQVADAGRVADGVALAAHRQVQGYRRMIVGKTCARCIVLAGRWYRWNAGFRRHPRCDCVHVPAAESADEVRTNPRVLFESMSREEQDQVFTKAGAEAIRLGADISQVVNARRGAAGLTPAGARITAEEARLLRDGRDVGRLQPVDVFGRQLFVTTEGTTTRGLAGVRLGARESGVKQEGARYRSARPPRLMPESIFAIADGNRDEAVRLLRRFGYVR